jgi:hypothetical protein
MRNQGISCDILAFSTKDWGKAQKKRRPTKKPAQRQDNREVSPIHSLTDLIAAV